MKKKNLVVLGLVVLLGSVGNFNTWREPPQLDTRHPAVDEPPPSITTAAIHIRVAEDLSPAPVAFAGKPSPLPGSIQSMADLQLLSSAFEQKAALYELAGRSERVQIKQHLLNLLD